MPLVSRQVPLGQESPHSPYSSPQVARFAVGPYGEGFARLEGALEDLLQHSGLSNLSQEVTGVRAALSVLRTQFSSVVTELEANRASKAKLQQAVWDAHRRAGRLSAELDLYRRTEAREQDIARQKRRRARAEANELELLHSTGFVEPTPAEDQGQRHSAGMSRSANANANGGTPRTPRSRVGGGRANPGTCARCAVCTLPPPCEHSTSVGGFGADAAATPPHVRKLRREAGRGEEPRVAGGGRDNSHGATTQQVQEKILHAAVTGSVARSTAFQKAIDERSIQVPSPSQTQQQQSDHAQSAKVSKKATPRLGVQTRPRKTLTFADTHSPRSTASPRSSGTKTPRTPRPRKVFHDEQVVHTLKQLSPPNFHIDNPLENAWRKHHSAPRERDDMVVNFLSEQSAGPRRSSGQRRPPPRRKGKKKLRPASAAPSRNSQRRLHQRVAATSSPHRRTKGGASREPRQRRGERPASAPRVRRGKGGRRRKPTSAQQRPEDSPYYLEMPRPGPSDYMTSVPLGQRQVDARIATIASSFSFTRAKRS